MFAAGRTKASLLASIYTYRFFSPGQPGPELSSQRDHVKSTFEQNTESMAGEKQTTNQGREEIA